MTVSLPRELGGIARGTNPEELLVNTAASCYLITLAIILEKRGIPAERLDIISTGTMDDEKIKITKLVHEPKIKLASAPTVEQLSSIAEAIQRAEQMCPIAKAIRGNVEIVIVSNEATIEATIESPR
jgi:peroxiredoxin-like protein